MSSVRSMLNQVKKNLWRIEERFIKNISNNNFYKYSHTNITHTHTKKVSVFYTFE